MDIQRKNLLVKVDQYKKKIREVNESLCQKKVKIALLKSLKEDLKISLRSFLKVYHTERNLK